MNEKSCMDAKTRGCRTCYCIECNSGLLFFDDYLMKLHIILFDKMK